MGSLENLGHFDVAYGTMFGLHGNNGILILVFDCTAVTALGKDVKVTPEAVKNKMMEKMSVHNETEDKIVSQIFKDFGIKREEECPFGTVIIKRLTKEDLIREKIASNRRRRSCLYNENCDIHVAGARVKHDIYCWGGAGGELGIYKPFVFENQYSAARVSIQRGPDRIEVGWRVDPTLNKDEKTRLYIQTKATRIGSHCYGTRCPGFIATTPIFKMDDDLGEVSKRGKNARLLQVDITRDHKSGDWHLSIGTDDRIKLGYWPKEIFSKSGLQKCANYIDWGGEVYSPKELPFRTKMGYGKPLEIDTTRTSYISRLIYRTEYGDKLNANIDVGPWSDVPYYRSILEEWTDEEFKVLVFYGGPEYEVI